MAEGDGSSNTAIVAILVIVIALLGIFFYNGGFGFFGDRATTTVESPTTNIIERPTTPVTPDRR